MAYKATLDDIALGEASPAQAREAISAAFHEISPQVAQRVYTVLRAWTWKALNGRRRDPELREWFDIIKRAGAFLSGSNKPQSERLQVLHELLYESISASEILSVGDVLKRQHTRDVLLILFDAKGHQLERAVIGGRLKLKQPNLTRVLNLMSSAGLIERVKFGKQAIFQLSALGAAEAKKIREETVRGCSYPEIAIFEIASSTHKGIQSALETDMLRLACAIRKRPIKSKPTPGNLGPLIEVARGGKLNKPWIIQVDKSPVAGRPRAARSKKLDYYDAPRIAKLEEEGWPISDLVSEKLEAVPSYKQSEFVGVS